MAEQSGLWRLVETLTRNPTVIAEGTKPRQFRSLDGYLRGFVRDLTREAVAAARVSRRSSDRVVVNPRWGSRRVLGIPVLGPTGEVHGVQVWIGRSEMEPEPPLTVAGWEWNVAEETGPRRARWTPEFRRMYGLSGDHPEDQEFGLADVYAHIVRPSDVARAMQNVDDAKPGDSFEITVLVRHDDGTRHRVRSVRRAVETVAGVALRGIDQDVTADVETGDLLIASLDADIAAASLAAMDGHAAIIDARAGYVIKWVTEPLPEATEDAKGGRQALLHPDDAVKVTRALTGASHVRCLVRVAAATGTWIHRMADIHVTVGHGRTLAALASFLPEQA